MLTKRDLVSISEVVGKKIEKEFEVRLKPIKDDISQIRKDQKIIVHFFDREYLDLRKRVEKIESFQN